MANITLLTLDDPVDGSLTIINGNFTAINTELGSHTHDASAITSGVFSAARLASGTPTTSSFLRGDSVWAAVTWNDVSGKPTTFPPSTHVHAAADITAGVLAPARLGSGAASASTFLRGDQQWAAISLNNLAETGGYFYRAGASLVWENPPSTYTDWIGPTLELYGFSGSDVPTGGGLIMARSSRGTPSDPLPLKANDVLFGIVYQGRCPNGNLMEGGRIWLSAPADWTNTSTPADLVISLNAPGESSYFNEKFYFKGTGRLGIKTSSPAYELDVNGTARTTNLFATNIGIGTTTPAHPLHANVSEDGQGIRLDRGGSARALIAQDSSGGVIQLFDASQNLRLQLYAGWYSKIPNRLGVNLSGDPSFELDVGGLGWFTSPSSRASVSEIGNLTLASVSAAKRLALGVDTSSSSVMHGWLQCVESGVSYRPLALQPRGGGVSIGYTPTVAASNTLEIHQSPGEYAAIMTVNASGTRAIVIGHYPVYGDAFNDITGSGGDLRLYAENNLLHMRSGMRLARYTSTPPLSGITSNGDCIMYMKDSKLVIGYNDYGTMRYKYLDLSGTGTTWVHTTTAP
jgi:hypothetical protein